ncbi:hypothetical protein P4391_21460 [Bacillus thuringiensis]|uniref:ABC transporter permease n=1 Tax=Bacillus thuringiensis serovar toumanoffi TaxID=180862 RepID=A0ABD5HS86_BACTU|nr:hypothetical protein [Bacillus thuringiensis]AMR88136.1 hypothetical protein A3L20_29365 [Bacillus thuringiensis]MBG9634609.1 hypothetical protein [Bacillus thuringiensis]MBG9673825.1 hypothetical protein [Bacillus thuringiensis]MDW9207754.1 hypothetical protein [Bacillus thuringiensis serovar toumanoffi]MDW9207789.1 hypothetical protein [Bacillus thuringiensis serovar toumanoffi]
MKFREKDIIQFLIPPSLLLGFVIILSTINYIQEIDMSFEEIIVYTAHISPLLCIVSVLLSVIWFQKRK